MCHFSSKTGGGGTGLPRRLLRAAERSQAAMETAFFCSVGSLDAGRCRNVGISGISENSDINDDGSGWGNRPGSDGTRGSPGSKFSRPEVGNSVSSASQSSPDFPRSRSHNGLSHLNIGPTVYAAGHFVASAGFLMYPVSVPFSDLKAARAVNCTGVSFFRRSFVQGLTPMMCMNLNSQKVVAVT